MNIWLLVICSIAIALYFHQRSSRLRRDEFIRKYTFSSEVMSKVKDSYPHLEEKDLFLLARALRQFFIIHNQTKPKIIGMPSKAVDALWHELILNTREYTKFCKKAFGGYFHHIPASKSVKGEVIKNGMRLLWKYACLEENINPQKPTRLPLLFAIDDKLKITDGNKYTLATYATVAAASSTVASNSANSCGGVACGGLNSSDSSCSGSSGCSGGCSGGGCGGGCGGS